MEDLVQILTKFHRQIVVPDIEHIVGSAVDGAERRLRDEMHALYDSLAHEMKSLRLQEQVRTLEGRLED